MRQYYWRTEASSANSIGAQNMTKYPRNITWKLLAQRVWSALHIGACASLRQYWGRSSYVYLTGIISTVYLHAFSFSYLPLRRSPYTYPSPDCWDKIGDYCMSRSSNLAREQEQSERHYCAKFALTAPFNYNTVYGISMWPIPNSARWKNGSYWPAKQSRNVSASQTARQPSNQIDAGFKTTLAYIKKIPLHGA